MSKTVKQKPRNPMSVEKAEVRRQHIRRRRVLVRELMSHGRWDDIPPIRGTQGWDSW